MRVSSRKIWFWIAIAFGLLLMVSGLLLSISILNTSKERPSEQPALMSMDKQYFLPALLKEYKRKPRYGMEIYTGPQENYEDYWNGQVLKLSININDVQPEPLPLPNWEKTDNRILEADLLYLGFRDSGEYMLAEGDPICKLPLPEYWDDWVAVVLAAIERYDPDMISILNEPDTSNENFAYYLGCIGPNYSHGVQYAEFFNYVYAEIKSEHPDLIILAGELTDPFLGFAQGFIDNVTEFDALAIHYYQYCYGEDTLDEDIEQAQSLTDKPIWVSETSVIRNDNSAAVEQMQVDHWNRMRNETEIAGFIWFTLEDSGWLFSAAMRGDRCKPICCEYNEIEDCEIVPYP